MGSYLRYHRKKSGLSQRELAQVVGANGTSQLVRHEKFEATPTLIAAIGYHIAFKASVAELFPGVYESVRQGVEQRLTELERQLEQHIPKGRKQMEETADKLMWLRSRKERGELSIVNEEDA